MNYESWSCLFLIMKVDGSIQFQFKQTKNVLWGGKVMMDGWMNEWMNELKINDDRIHSIEKKRKEEKRSYKEHDG